MLRDTWHAFLHLQCEPKANGREKIFSRICHAAIFALLISPPAKNTWHNVEMAHTKKQRILEKHLFSHLPCLFRSLTAAQAPWTLNWTRMEVNEGWDGERANWIFRKFKLYSLDINHKIPLNIGAKMSERVQPSQHDLILAVRLSTVYR